MQNLPCAFTPSFSKRRFLRLRRSRQERTGREKILPSCPTSLHNEVLKGNLSFFLPARAGHSPGERRAVSSPSPAPRSYCSCSAQRPKYQGGWQGLLEATSAPSWTAAKREGRAAHAGQRGRTRRRAPDSALPAVIIARGERGNFVSCSEGNARAASAFCRLRPPAGAGGESLSTDGKEGPMTAADPGTLLIDFPGVPGGGYCVSNGLIAYICRYCCSFAIPEHC